MCALSVLELQPLEKQIAMRNTPGKPSQTAIRPEYVLDYSKAKPNRFAVTLQKTRAVILQPDVAAVFSSAEAVNDFLRSAIVATSGKKSPKVDRQPVPRSKRRAA
jgi:hypothetical protein